MLCNVSTIIRIWKDVWVVASICNMLYVEYVL